MAAKDLDSDDTKKQELDDMITCCICTEVYTDPKELPCIHTFCMKCLQENGLKTNKGPGNEMPCPICRRMFNIPREGFRGLPKNFFIERLIQVANASGESASSIVLCDACVEENKEEAGKQIPAADTYCVDCNQKFCQECCRQHRKFKLTKHHRLMPMTEYESGQTLMVDLVPSICELHEQKVLDVYCSDCKTVVCYICFIDDHKNHDGSHVNKFVDVFRKQIESNSEAINECRSKAEMVKAEILKVKEDVQKRVENLECDVEKRKDELKQFADKHATSLLQGLCPIRQSKMKEIQMASDDIDAYLSILETYISYCQKVMVKGSASDICGAFSDLSVRAVELQQQCQVMIEKREIQSLNHCFRKSELEEFIEESCDNFIGEIEEESASRQKKISRQSLLAEQIKEIDLLRKEIEMERTNQESFRLAHEQLRINTNKEAQANRVLTVELSKEKANNDLQIKKLKQELDNNKITINTLQAEKVITSKLKAELDKEKIANSWNKASCNKLEQEVIIYKTTIKALEDTVEKLNNKLETTKADTLRSEFKLHPVLVHAIRTKATEEKKKSICGMAILEKELFVVNENSQEVEVYDSIVFSFNRRWNLKELIRPTHLVSCSRNKCLYILDYKEIGQSKEILRVDPRGKLIKKWSTGDEGVGGLSITGESNIISAVSEKNKLNEYSPNGQLIREVNLSTDAGIHRPSNAIKLTNGNFVVCHGLGDGDMHRVCVVDANGILKKSFGGKRGSTIGQLNYPISLSVSGYGFVMVADRWNSRVLLLDSDLDFKREILSKEVKHRLRCPTMILLDDLNGRLLVADNDPNNELILIFDFK